ncbi:hypothetical protein A0H81_04766 [Grifola frondosa]|uniref:Uncharacterized protein n=1 Tax=Grifola frondosa TaxID=5627 RepID=A0A1C7MEX8_GRIFR|nr:hypothetical protein A0H81_04766 [Grifola frondosa]
MDIFFEVEVNSALRTPGNIWIAARRNIPHFPSNCPPDLSEPPYASLGFRTGLRCVQYPTSAQSGSFPSKFNFALLSGGQ